MISICDNSGLVLSLMRASSSTASFVKSSFAFKVALNSVIFIMVLVSCIEAYNDDAPDVDELAITISNVDVRKRGIPDGVTG